MSNFDASDTTFHTKACVPTRELIDAVDRPCGEADWRPADAAQSKPQHRMMVDRCDFQVPPAVPGWNGILSEAGSKAAFWNGTDWVEYPVRAYARSMKAFDTEEAALDWATSQPDSVLA